ncbi:MAG: MBL fold metallo-hydrolase [Pseudonocardiaceae bacterium]|nr:MBL fold metallo-hydrolase [Pseudonocardiaceae bacterium]
MSTGHGGTDTAPTPVVEELGHGFHAYVQLDGSWGLNNCGIFVGESGVVLVDTAFTQRRAHALAAEVDRLTDKPVQALINTHHHGDHTHGNFVFDQAAVIGHRRCRDAMIASGFEVTRWFGGVDFGDIKLVPPFVTFEDSLTVHCDDKAAELHSMGPAHTDNDIVVWVEEIGLLFAGDLVFNGGTPFVLMGSVEGSLRALERLRGYDIRQLVPGHGPVCGPEAIGDQIDYLTFVRDVAGSSFDARVSPLDAARDTDLGRFAAWTDPERLVGNLHRAHSELRGEPLATPLDYHRIVDEMIDYNGGSPLRCLA